MSNCSMFLALYLWSKRNHNPLFLWISLHSCHLGDFRFCLWAKISGYRARNILEVHMGVHMASRSQYKHIVFPCLRLGAVVFPKVSSCGPCARLSGELRRGWRRLACWVKTLATCAFCGTATSPCLQIPSPPTTSSLSRRITGRNCRLYPSLVCTTAITTWQGSWCAVPFSI